MEEEHSRVETDPPGVEARSSQGFVGVTPATIPFKVKPGKEIALTVTKGSSTVTGSYAQGTLEELRQNQ